MNDVGERIKALQKIVDEYNRIISSSVRERDIAAKMPVYLYRSRQARKGKIK